MDAFDRYWEWANKPVGSRLMLDGRLYNPIMELSEKDRKDRGKVNGAVARYVWPGDETNPLFAEQRARFGEWLLAVKW